MQETIDGFLFSSLQGSRIATSNIGLIWTLSSKPKPCIQQSFVSEGESHCFNVLIVCYASKPITPSPYYTRLDSSQSLPYETMMAALSHLYRLVLDHDDLTKK